MISNLFLEDEDYGKNDKIPFGKKKKRESKWTFRGPVKRVSNTETRDAT